jgi:hypothetical protein
VTCGRSVVSYTNSTDRHDLTGILLKVTLNTITLTPNTDVNKITTNELEHKLMKSKPKLEKKK